jgi:hypothetical protein
MRPLTSLEQERIKFLTKSQVSLALIEPTETGLKKSIMDATTQVRNYLEENDFHDFNSQIQGPNDKVIVAAHLYDGRTVKKSKASLYRPITKNGDPRIWFYGLTSYAEPHDIVGIIAYENKLHVFNLTQISIDSFSKSPFKELIDEIRQLESEVSSELLIKLRKIAAQGFIKSEVNADTGIGRTLESLLGIEMNSSKTPDYKGIELKSARDSRSTRKGLFAKTPNWELSKFKSRVEILDAFGYWEKGVFRLYNTIRATGRNGQGLILKIEPKKDWLLENSDQAAIGDFLVWELQVLRKVLKEKHRETFWVSAESRIEDGHEYFQFNLAKHTKDPMVEQFDTLIEMGAITLDYPIKRTKDGKVIDKGCNFKLKASCMDLLFPPSETYDLINYA